MKYSNKVTPIGQQVEEWQAIGLGNVSEQEIYRHFLFLGETGSGKTLSGIMPMCRLAFGQGQPRAAGLVVDPKGELGPYIESVSGEADRDRFIRLNSDNSGPVFWYFENTPITNLCGHSLVEEMMKFADSYTTQKAKSAERFWVDGASQLLASLVNIDLDLYRHRNLKGTQNIRNFWRHLYGLIDWMNELPPGKDLEEIFKRFRNREWDAELLEEKLPGQGRRCPHSYRPNNYLHHLQGVMTASSYYASGLQISGICAVVGKGSFLPGGTAANQFWGLFVAFLESYRLDGQLVFDGRAGYFRQFVQMATDTYASLHAVFNSLVNELLSPEFTSRVSLNPFERPDNLLDARQIIEDGRVVIYEPRGTTQVAACIGKVLKAGFFKALLQPERLNNPAVRPFFYLCDEFQRFITHDAESGEQSFLDRCRAYRVCCALATQSLASLEHVFADISGHHAINIILNNTGTKLFFRTTDTGTAASLCDLIPAPVYPGRPHVVRVRPPSTLQPGECYFVAVNGRVGRGQVRLAARQEE